MRRGLVALLGLTLTALCLRAAVADPPGDFHNQRTAARAFLRCFEPGEEPGHRLYDWIEFQRWVDREGYEGLLGAYIPQPPAAMLPYVPVAPLSHRAGKILFSLVSLGLFLGSAWHLARALELPAETLVIGLAAVGGSLTANLVNGQEMLLVAALTNLSFSAWMRDRETSAGLAMGSAAALKLFGIPWLLLALLRRRLRLLLAAGAAGAALTAIATASFGWPMLQRFCLDVLPAALQGRFHNLFHPESQSLETIARRLFLGHPDWNPEPLVGDLPGLYGFLARLVPSLVLLLALASAMRWFEQDRAHGLALLLVATLVAAPIANRYHLVPLLPALLVLSRAGPRIWGIALAAAALACWSPQGPTLALQEPRVVGTFVVLALLLVRRPPGRSAAAALVAVSVGLALLFPARQPVVPAGWTRATPTPFPSILALSPARDGSALELEYESTEAGNRFRWAGYSYDRSRLLQTLYERLDPDGRSGIWYEDALGNGRWLIRLPDADCRSARWWHGSVLFHLENGSYRAPFLVDLDTAQTQPAESLWPAELGDPLLSPPDVSVDGRYVAFVVRSGLHTEIRELDRESGSTRTLVGPFARSREPRFSWDGRYLYFASDAGRCSGCTVIFGVPTGR